MPQSTTQPATLRRWTEDTRVAFLLALRLHGSAMRAAAAIGRQPAVCYKVREREPGFAAEWDRIVAQQRAARSVARRLGPDAAGAAGGAVARNAAGHRRRRDGLTTVKRRAFLRALSEHGTVAAACRAAEVSDTAVYRLRGDDADFATAWDRALRTAAPALEQVAWERAVEGWEETVYRDGKVVGTRRRYSETLLRQLIIRRDKAVALSDDPKVLVKRAEAAARAAGGRFMAALPDRAEVDAAIRVALDRAKRRIEDAELRAAEEAGLFTLARWMQTGEGAGVVDIPPVGGEADGAAM